jgi:hypothetical protein
MTEIEMQLEKEKLSLERERLAVERARIENARDRISEQSRSFRDGAGHITVPLSTAVLAGLLCLAAGGIAGSLFCSMAVNSRHDRHIANIVKTLEATTESTNSVQTVKKSGDLKQSFKGAVKKRDAYENVSLIVIQGN